MSPLVGFLTGDGRDHAGRTFEDVLAFADAELESRHDFIQWLFPLTDPSRAVPSAPVLAPADVASLRASGTARARLRRAAARMLEFYRDNARWKAPADHNHLRITRIVRSLRLLVGDADADAFRDAVTALAGDAPISPTTRRFWAEA